MARSGFGDVSDVPQQARTTASLPAPRTAGSIEVVAEPTASTITVHLVGEHDLATARLVGGVLDEQLERCDRLAVDLNRTTFLDTSVLTTLVEAARRTRPRGVTFHVVAAEGSHAHNILSLMRLLDYVGWLNDDVVFRASANGVATGPGERLS